MTAQIVAVAAIVFHNGRVLAMRRAASKDAGAGLWETLSGRVELGEDPVEAVQREIREESGLDVVLDARPLTTYAALRGDKPMTVIVYRAEASTDNVVPSAEHDAHAWLTPAEFRVRSSLARLADAIDYAARLPW